MANNQVIVIQVKDKDGNEDRYYNQSDILPDMLLEVGGDSTIGTKTTFHVHHSVLKESSSIFGELLEADKGDTATITIPLIGVSPHIFHYLIFDMYGGTVSNNILRDHAKDIIDVADMFGVEKLKLKAEEMYLEQNAITFDNIMDTLLYSDAKNCTIIKAAVMDCLVNLSDTAFVQQLSFKGVPGHLMKDLLTAVVRVVGSLNVLAKETSEKTAKNTRDIETNRRAIATNRAERLIWQRETDERLDQMKAEHIASKKETDKEILQLKKRVSDLEKFTRAKLRKAIVLSFLVGVVSAVTIGYVLAYILLCYM